jgi:hypothetical protein
LIVTLSIFGAARDANEDSPLTVERVMGALIFRLPGLDTVERVVWRLEQGEPYKGIGSSVTEAATIVIPRAIWPTKPAPASLEFSDIFFFDFFLNRGDSLDAIRSGIAPTLIGEALWIDGIPCVMVLSLTLGILAPFFVEWRKRGTLLHVFIYAIFMARFPLFVETFQGTLNLYVMYAVVLLGLVYLASLCFHGRPHRSPPAGPSRRIS